MSKPFSYRSEVARGRLFEEIPLISLLSDAYVIGLVTDLVVALRERQGEVDQLRRDSVEAEASLGGLLDQSREARDALARKEGKEQEAELKRQRKLVADRMVREKHSEELAYKMHSAR